MHLSTIETVLEYQVNAPTHFCFGIQTAHWPTQNIVSERLSVSSSVALRSFTDAASGNRFFRFDASPGPLLLDYKADVEVYAEHVGETCKRFPWAGCPMIFFTI